MLIGGARSVRKVGRQGWGLEKKGWGADEKERGGSYLRLIDSCITQLKDQGPYRTCNESQKKEGRTSQRGGRASPRQVRV